VFAGAEQSIAVNRRSGYLHRLSLPCRQSVMGTEEEEEKKHDKRKKETGKKKQKKSFQRRDG
jgi:hypothetical protein